MKCLVQDCTNHNDQGTFVGWYCTPCHEFLFKQVENKSQAYCNYVAIKDEELCVKKS